MTQKHDIKNTVLILFILILSSSLVSQSGLSSGNALSYQQTTNSKLVDQSGKTTVVGQLTNETINSDIVQNFRSLQQASINNTPLQYAVFFVTENDTCTATEYKSLKFYQVVTDEYLTLYNLPHDLQGSLCVPFRNYQSYFSGLSTYTLPVIISDNAVGQQLVQQGYYGMYEISGTGMQVIYVCSCDPNVESWAGAWILSHELSHFALHYFGESDIIYIAWVHYIQALENNCQLGNFSVVCSQYSTAVTAPSGNEIPVMEIFGQGPTSYNMPSNPPQSEISTSGKYYTNPTNSPNTSRNENTKSVSDSETIPKDNFTGLITSNQFGFLHIDRNEYDVSYVNSTFVKVSGTISNLYSTDIKITIIFTLPDGNIKGSQISPNVDGSFQISLPLDSNSQKGMYVVSASYGGAKIGSLTFMVKQVPAYNPLLNNNIALTNQSAEKSGIVSSSGKMNIPSWIKNNAKWWHDNTIGDSEFEKGIQYMIQQGIMKIPQTQSGMSTTKQIPSWVKSNAGWWANGQISDDEFVKGIQFLVQAGVIKAS